MWLEFSMPALKEIDIVSLEISEVMVALSFVTC